MAERNVIEVFTNKSVEFMMEYGGSASWAISTKSAAGLDYCICCRNDERPREDDRGARNERRNEAFLVGKVSGIEFVENQNGRDRYLLKFSAYAVISIPGFRTGTTRNPVVYSTEAECRSRDLDFEAVEFQPMPPTTKRYTRFSAQIASEEESTKAQGISIAEAKEGLAIYFDVPVESIQITISA